jgi:prepilin-type N-terminal cleavage/methylation domain-containing protein
MEEVIGSNPICSTKIRTLTLLCSCFIIHLTMQRTIIPRVTRANRQRGFTIVELLIVVVIIAILATITIVAYNGVQQRAIAASIQSDLDNASKKLKLFQVDNSAYPTANDCSTTPIAGSICLKAAVGTTYTAFQVSNSPASSQSFCLTAMQNGVSYRITNDSIPTAGSCSGVMLSGIGCPSGFIVVPGSSTYGTSDFCVMKYDAKQSSGTVPISQAVGTPWVGISQADAVTDSANVAGCTGCHLVTESEWLTIAQNVASVASNWSSGTVGSGFIYSGHNDNVPASILAADTNDANGYSGTGNSSPSNQRRTLTLTNGEVIWDFSGNVWEWTSGSINGGAQPGFAGETSYAWKDWNNGALLLNGLASSTIPSYGIASASGWTSSQGIGQLFSNHGESAARIFVRGGSLEDGASAGIFTLDLYDASTVTNAVIGFRVSR